MKRLATAFAIAMVLAFGTQAACSQTLKAVQGSRPAGLRREWHAGRFRHARSARQLGRLRRRFLPRHRGGDLQRSDQGQICAADRGQPVHGAAIGRNRRAVAQYDLDDVARHHARRRFCRRQLLRRPGLHGAQVAEGELGARAQRRLGLRAAGHHDRAQSRRLFPLQSHDAQDRDIRDGGRGGQSLRHQPLRCLHHRFIRPLRRAAAADRSERTTSCCRRSSPRSRSARRFARATTPGKTSCAGPITPWSMPKSSA